MAPDIPAGRAETARLSQGPRTPATRKAAFLQGRPHVLQLARTHLWTLWAAPFTEDWEGPASWPFYATAGLGVKVGTPEGSKMC